MCKVATNSYSKVYLNRETVAEEKAAKKLSDILLKIYPDGDNVSVSSMKKAEEALEVCWLLQGTDSSLPSFDIRKLKVPEDKEGYLLKIDQDSKYALVVSRGKRGKVYGLYDLCERLELSSGLPKSLEVRETPFFKYRRWTSAISNLHRQPWDERINLIQGWQRIGKFIELAPEYRINSLEIHGRPHDGWDPDLILPYEKYKEFRPLRPLLERKYRLALLEELAQQAKKNLVDLYVWSHELYFPQEFFTFYPHTRGIDYDVCPSQKFVQDFIRNKYTELFENVPSLKGIVLTLAESGIFSITLDRGCQCKKCKNLTTSQRVAKIVSLVAGVCKKYGKEIVARTFRGGIKDLYGDPGAEIIRKAYRDLPSYVKIMSKYCPIDFQGGEITDDPLIGAFKKEHLVEFSLDREWQGRTFIPNITPLDFQKRIQHAVAKRCVGTVARVDFCFPEMEPEPDGIFNHPNEFNAYVCSRLSWDPNCDIEGCWKRWAKAKYGDKASSEVISALKKTEDISEKLFFFKGATIVNYHNMIPPLSFGREFLEGSLPSKWNSSKSKRKLTERFLHPDEKFIKSIIADAEKARRLSEEGLRELRQVRSKMERFEHTRLIYYFEKLRDFSILRKSLVELFFRYLALGNERIVDFESDDFRKITHVANNVLKQSLKMESTHGIYSWPIFSPDRGISAYEFVQQLLGEYLTTFIGEEMKIPLCTRWLPSFWTHMNFLTPRHLIIEFWDSIIKIARGKIGDRETLSVRDLASSLSSLELNTYFLRLIKDDRSFDLPVGIPIKGLREINPLEVGQIEVVKIPGGIRMEALLTPGS